MFFSREQTSKKNSYKMFSRATDCREGFNQSTLIRLIESYQSSLGSTTRKIQATFVGKLVVECLSIFGALNVMLYCLTTYAGCSSFQKYCQIIAIGNNYYVIVYSFKPSYFNEERMNFLLMENKALTICSTTSYALAFVMVLCATMLHLPGKQEGETE